MKFTEFQRYARTHGNQLARVEPGALFVVGRTGNPQLVDAVAVVEALPVLRQQPTDVPSVLNFAAESLRDDLRAYLDGCACFDYVHFATIYDVRGKSLSTADFFRLFDIIVPGHQVGYPQLKSTREDLHSDILNWSTTKEAATAVEVVFA